MVLMVIKLEAKTKVCGAVVVGAESLRIHQGTKGHNS